MSAFNNFFGSVVGIQNALLAPLAPFGRKLSQHAQAQQDATFVDTVGNTQTNPVRCTVLLSTNEQRTPHPCAHAVSWCSCCSCMLHTYSGL